MAIVRTLTVSFHDEIAKVFTVWDDTTGKLSRIDVENDGIGTIRLNTSGPATESLIIAAGIQVNLDFALLNIPMDTDDDLTLSNPLNVHVGYAR